MGPTGGLFTGKVIAADIPPPGAGFTAVTDKLPVADKSAAVRVTLTCVELVKLVGRALPFTLITVEETNPVPATTTFADSVPTSSVAGSKVDTVGTGFGATIATVVAVEVPPPGFEFTAVRERLPAVDTSAALSVTLICVELVKVVVRVAPFTLMTVVGTNPVPVTVMFGEVVPAGSLVGDTEVIAGAGLSTSRLTGVPDPLVSEPFDTTTVKSAPLTSWLAGTVAVNSVLLTKVVDSEMLFTWTTLVLRNPEPETVKVNAFEPADTLVGLIEEIVGGGVVLPPPPDPPEPTDPLELEPPPPQPLTRTGIPSPRNKAKKRTEESCNLAPEHTFTKGPFLPTQLFFITMPQNTLGTILLRSHFSNNE